MPPTKVSFRRNILPISKFKAGCKSIGMQWQLWNFGSEFRLFVDGVEKAHKFGLFTSGNFPGSAGETWTTWQFAPNPIPHEDAYGAEAEAWVKTTRGLSAGTHAVRFESCRW